MKLNYLIAILSLSLIFGACFSEKDEDIVHHDFNEHHAVLPVVEEITADTQMVWLSDSAISIDLDSISVKLDSLEIWIDTIKSNRDTTFIYLELGSSLADHYFAVNSTYDSSSILVTYHFETSLTVSDEGPHCDLIDWKHYISAPDTLAQLDSTGVYQFKNGYQDSMSTAFPEITMKEVRRAVVKHCSEGWMERTKESKTIRDYPFSVSISREIIHIVIKNDKGDIIREKFIIFEIPMGC